MKRLWLFAAAVAAGGLGSLLFVAVTLTISQNPGFRTVFAVVGLICLAVMAGTKWGLK